MPVRGGGPSRQCTFAEDARRTEEPSRDEESGCQLSPEVTQEDLALGPNTQRLLAAGQVGARHTRVAPWPDSPILVSENFGIKIVTTMVMSTLGLVISVATWPTRGRVPTRTRALY